MKSRETNTAPLDHSPERQSTAIPVVKLTKEEVAHGLLTERQRTWADGFPNDPYVENPVLHKYVISKVVESVCLIICFIIYCKSSYSWWWLSTCFFSQTIHLGIKYADA